MSEYSSTGVLLVLFMSEYSSTGVFAVWLELMLPVLNIRGLSSFCVHFIETLLRSVVLLMCCDAAVLITRKLVLRQHKSLPSMVLLPGEHNGLNTVAAHI